MYDIIIVGAGPAGMTAAIYALRARKKVLIIEGNAYGGQIVNASKIVNYPGIISINGFDFANNLYEQVKSFGGVFKFERVVSVTEGEVTTNKDTYKAKAIILATGVQNRKLNLENEKEFLGHGVSYCATCDGNFFKEKIVAIVGGGNTAIDDALYMSHIASKVYLIHRRSEFRSEEDSLLKLKELDNVEFILNANVKALNGSECLESIDVVFNDDTIKNIKVDGLFIAIGQVPCNDIFSNVVDIDSNGYIVSSDGVHTKTPYIYVAGDARIKNLRQLTTAVSDGSISATTAIREISK